MIDKKVSAAFFIGTILSADITAGFFLENEPMIGIGMAIGIAVLFTIFIDAFVN